ncbi:type III restriction-modification system endonuclease [Clostridium botulinum]|uniref:type III restriction-modification system endonuclease n=1 Tax=Clostridium botulinum TaxID=1491 RepID=UPI00069AB0A7|nr:DEAD/DEAH box helicase family protein [Clostridium botulinum]KOA78101.1 type III restriction endonuclease subunit R [Clostridium botulinum]MCD3276180.1 DEAD/DEAH box helicase family protein [Clostridium botulinum C/D]MCD3287922.1 DEAD/DEAH box helicase family protein [Clostridium botulinum C/D]MCD3290026.1 DEAD/DEAH box helicase family protein [Clostridium botulinum C/D]MCD3304018.1 DEAD/DEAH box helicase family protein [Clostridium botulinum C/D]
MKIKFSKNLEYQKDAIDSIVNVFEGQSIAKDNFTVSIQERQVGIEESKLGIGNRLDITKEEIVENLNRIQIKNALPCTNFIKDKQSSLNLSVEMETGTGKTYVYLRTIFELNKNYGFTKFIIVVPSLAIKEGVNKSLELMEDHFKEELYKNVPYHHFIYDSQKLNDVRNFATSSNIEIMIINIDAFRKSFTDPEKETKANIIHRTNDKLSGYKPIEFISQTNPIVIIDEPQSVDNTPKSKEAIASLNPLAILRYSATHKEKLNLVYKLDAVDAYEKELVKQIEVISVIPKDSNNKAYIKLIRTSNTKSGISAKVEIDVLTKGKIKRVTKTVKKGTDLEEVTNRELYEGFIIDEIYCEKENEYISFTSNDILIKKGQAYGDIDHDELKRVQIRKTIEEHLDKELILTKEGIKVLSLFFIDKVSNYRYYDEEGNPNKGKYALIFEEEYKKIIKKPKYNTLFNDVDIDFLAKDVHNGYFSTDKKGKITDTKGNTSADEDAYALIMKDKEKLLSFDTKLRFIFSHSALREGWDNPNVFQICTLNETKSEIKKRQEIGRGLRLAVNQQGERVYGHDINTLTVMVNESYEDFVENLQKEIEDDQGIKFGFVDKYIFSNISYETEEGSIINVGATNSEKLWNFLKEEDYIDNRGNIKEKLRMELKNNTLILPEEFKKFEPMVKQKLTRFSGDLNNIKDGSKKRKIYLNKEVFLGKDFTELWDKIKYKTTYSVDFDSTKLVDECIKAINTDINVGRVKIEVVKAEAKIAEEGVTAKETDRVLININEKVELPDILTYLQNETNLTRKTLVDILIKSQKLELFKMNPSKFMQEISRIIKRTLNSFIVDGIKYEKIGDEEYTVQEVFKNEELYGYLTDNIVESKRSIYNYVKYDSNIEKSFAEKLEDNERVKVYAKLPSNFKIDTPIGKYNPDWAILIEKDGEQKLYFVVETKGTDQLSLLKDSEKAKIKCGKKHFSALNTGVGVAQANSFEGFVAEHVYNS